MINGVNSGGFLRVARIGNIQVFRLGFLQITTTRPGLVTWILCRSKVGSREVLCVIDAKRSSGFLAAIEVPSQVLECRALILQHVL